MRLIAAGIVCASILLTGCQTESHGADGGGHTDAALLNDTAKLQGDRADLVVFGMSCPLCATSLDKELARLKGFDSMTSDLGNGKVTVTFKGAERPTRGELAQAVQTAGFTVKSIN